MKFYQKCCKSSQFFRGRVGLVPDFIRPGPGRFALIFFHDHKICTFADRVFSVDLSQNRLQLLLIFGVWNNVCKRTPRQFILRSIIFFCHQKLPRSVWSNFRISHSHLINIFIRENHMVICDKVELTQVSPR